MTLAPTSIAVLLGGPSAEHDVSLVSGRAIARALAGNGHDVSGWLLTLERAWWSLPPRALDPELPAHAFRDPAALGAEGPYTAAAALEALATSRPAPVVFPALHGPFGEDGQVQSLLESAGLVYCGARPAASAVGMDKTLFKRVVATLELPVLPWAEVVAPELAADRPTVLAGLREFASGFDDPRLIVKPARQGSSIGVTIVHDVQAEALEAALDKAMRYDDLVLVEPYLEHPRELETAVMGNSRLDCVAYGPGEIVPGNEFYDFEAKYHSPESRTTELADLDPELLESIRAAAVEVFLVIGGSGFARVDMLLSSDGIPYISEINTLPGFTPISLFPRMTAMGGYDFASTCERIVELALERAAARPVLELRPDDLP
ncbi:MAG: D-alanine--D-alanine ligase family protein [Candidatus Limnocylindrales bacterium]